MNRDRLEIVDPQRRSRRAVGEVADGLLAIEPRGQIRARERQLDRAVRREQARKAVGVLGCPGDRALRWGCVLAGEARGSGS